MTDGRCAIPPGASAVLEIDLGALAANISFLKELAPRSVMGGVVKADAYGLGCEQVAAVHRAQGTKTFFVATPDEGMALRACLGPGTEIIVLGGMFRGAEGEYARHALTPVVNCLGDLERVPPGHVVALHIDTGMRRLGLDGAEAMKIANDPALLNNVNVTMVMSHFACADEPDHPLNREQAEKFSVFAGRFPAARKSLCNSAGLFLPSACPYDVLRPGMAVYGLNPTPARASPVKPVVRLMARVLQRRDILPGESVGYGAAYTADAPRRAATVAIGYADGFLRSLSSAGRVFWNGRPCPVLGRVSMDLIVVDVTDAGGTGPMPGDFVDVLGPGQDADALAAAAGTIGYEILTGFGGRYARRYTGGNAFQDRVVEGGAVSG